MPNDSTDHPELVTVITAVRNGEAYIEDAIRSVLAQTHPAIEYFVIDAQSTDRTNEIIERYRSHLAWYVSEADGGLADAWNKGLARASGKYIALLNADDFYAPDFIQRSLEVLRGHANRISFGSTVLIDPTNGLSGVHRGHFNRQKIGKGFGFLHTSCVVPRSVYQTVGLFDPAYRIGMDTEFLLRCVVKDVEFVPSSAVNYMRDGGMSAKLLTKARAEYRKSLQKHGFYQQFAWQDWVHSWLLKIQNVIGVSRKARWKSQLRFVLLALFNWLYNHAFCHSLRRWMLKASGCKLGEGAIIHPGGQFFSFGRINVGNGTVICPDCYLDNRHPISIGNDVMIAHGCRIYTTGHVLDCPYFRGFGKPVSIGDRAVMFANAVVMPGVTIGEGAVVLSNAVVTKDVAPYDVVGGNPAVKIRSRTSDLRYRLDYSDYFAM